MKTRQPCPVKILYLLDQWPLPTTSGAKVHDKLMLRCLTQDWQAEVAYWVGVHDPGEKTVVQGTKLVTHHKISWQSFPQSVWRLFMRRQPLHATEFLTAATQQHLGALIDTLIPDLIIMSCPKLAVLAPFVKTISNAKLIVDTHDVQVQRCRSIYQALAPYDIVERIKQLFLIYSYSIVEKHIYKQIDKAWVLKEEDKTLLESFHSVPQVDVVPNVIDPEMVQPHSISYARHHPMPVSCVFIGDYSYQPNEQSALSLMDVFGDARIDATEVPLFLIGVNPSETMIRRATHMRNVSITGRVTALQDYLHPVDAIFLVPLLAGGGVKRKVIEAMAFGCPVTTTRIGAEGLGLVDGETAVICSIEHFRDRLLELVSDRAQRLRLAERGHGHIHANFGYDKLRNAVRRSLEDFIVSR